MSPDTRTQVDYAVQVTDMLFRGSFVPSFHYLVAGRDHLVEESRDRVEAAGHDAYRNRARREEG